MGKTTAVAKRIGMFLMVCIAAIASVLSLSACDAAGSFDAYLGNELTQHHYADVTMSNTETGEAKSVYWVIVGRCHLKATYYHNGSQSWTFQNVASGSEVTIGDPITLNADEDPHFTECLSRAPASSAPAPKG